MTDLGRRIRAAIILSGRDVDDVAGEALNQSGRTLTRIMHGEREPREREIRNLAKALEVPEWFLRDGFSGQTDGQLEERLAVHAASVEGQLSAISADMAAASRKLDRLLRRDRDG